MLKQYDLTKNGWGQFTPEYWGQFAPEYWGQFQAVKWGLFGRNFQFIMGMNIYDFTDNSSNYYYTI